MSRTHSTMPLALKMTICVLFLAIQQMSSQQLARNGSKAKKTEPELPHVAFALIRLLKYEGWNLASSSTKVEIEGIHGIHVPHVVRKMSAQYGWHVCRILHKNGEPVIRQLVPPSCSLTSNSLFSWGMFQLFEKFVCLPFSPTAHFLK